MIRASARRYDPYLSDLGLPSAISGFPNLLSRCTALWSRTCARPSKEASPKRTIVRLQLDFEPQAIAEFDELKGLMGCASRAEVCQRALEWTNWTARQQAEGCRFLIIRRTGRQELVILPWERGDGPASGE